MQRHVMMSWIPHPLTERSLDMFGPVGGAVVSSFIFDRVKSSANM